MAITTTAQQELIPGYTAIARLGAGGYGEVWKVNAPGGLLKAVKVIYGYVAEERACREMKALHCIKEVRHPFLLSLERIEVIDGRLMIVTELADMSLVDRFEQCRKNNLPGIPREELIGYLRDASDALDYMLQTHSLQHLDVKPENLLITSGRAKVADFGLVKEIADKTRSLVGAMTPTYAAPEVFEGKASRYSDQYSLAIVFQEMLTGALPFPGRNAAQLASQHTRNRPLLASLCPTDREIVARALAKRPQDRFPTCREFIDALAGISRTPAKPAEPPQAPQRADQGTRALHQDETHCAAPAGGDRTEILDAPGAPRLPTAVRQMSSSIRRSAPREETLVVKVAAASTDLAPPDVTPGANTLRPAMFIGVGHTGLLALEKLQARFAERLGDKVVQEAYPMLAVETDGAVLSHCASRRFDAQNIVHIPLRQAHEYRENADQLLEWLGRRWLYNIPKSGETLGMRPWGRLAVIDHATTIVSKLRPRLAAVANGVTRKALAAVPGSEVRSGPARVYIVGSACGGTGGGAILELAYAVRNITKRLSADDLEVCAIITTSTNQCPTQAQLATANTVAFLQELQHYARCGAEGDRGSDPKAAVFAGNDFPLTHAYLVDLGNDLSTEAFDDRVGSVADYMYCDVATPLAAALDACRSSQPEEETHIDLKLRSFRLARFDGLGPDVLSALTSYLIASAAELWLTDIGGKGVAERYLEDNGSDAPVHAANAPDYSLRALLTSTAMGWYGRVEPKLFPPPAKPPLDAHQAKTQAARGELLKQLLAVRQAHLRPPASPDLASLLRRVAEQGREARITAFVEKVAEMALLKYVDALARHVAGANLLEILNAEAREQAQTLFCELTPDAEVSPSGAIRSSSRPALTYLQQRSQVTYPYGAGRRTFLLSPGEWLTPEGAQQLESSLQMHLVGNDAHSYVCEELQDISLGQMVQHLTRRHPPIADVLEHLHTRIDIAWSSPARPEP